MTLERMAEDLCKNFLKGMQIDWAIDVSGTRRRDKTPLWFFNCSHIMEGDPYEILSSPIGLELLKKAVRLSGVDYSIVYDHELYRHTVSFFDGFVTVFCCKRQEEFDAMIEGVYQYLKTREKMGNKA